MNATVFIERDQDYISHHGVKGMKWGVRHDPIHNKQKQGSSLDASSNKNKARRRKVLRNIAIGGAVAIGVGLSIYAYQKLGREYFDNVIRSGATLQTLKNSADHIDSGNAFYTAYRSSDKKKYLGLFGKNNRWVNGHESFKKNIKMTTNGKIKVAGVKTGQKVYEDLMKNDKLFAATVKSHNSLIGSPNTYKEFNTYHLLNGSTHNKVTSDRFYKALKEKGYGAVADINDRKYSGFNTKAAIIFDKNKLKKDSTGKIAKSINNVTHADVVNGRDFVEKEFKRRNRYTPKKIVAYGTIGTAYAEAVGLTVTSDKNINNRKA